MTRRGFAAAAFALFGWALTGRRAAARPYRGGFVVRDGWVLREDDL